MQALIWALHLLFDDARGVGRWAASLPRHVIDEIALIRTGRPLHVLSPPPLRSSRYALYRSIVSVYSAQNNARHLISG